MARTRYLSKIVNGIPYNTLGKAIADYHRQYHAIKDVLTLMNISFDEKELSQAMYEISRNATICKVQELESKTMIPEVETISDRVISTYTNIVNLPFDEAVIEIIETSDKGIVFVVINDGTSAGDTFKVRKPKHSTWDNIVVGNELYVTKVNYGQDNKYVKLSMEYVKPDGDEG